MGRRSTAVLGIRSGPEAIVVVVLAGSPSRLALRGRAKLGRARPTLHRRVRPFRVGPSVGHQGPVGAITRRSEDHGVLAHEAGVGTVVHAAMEPPPITDRLAVADTGLTAVSERTAAALTHDLAVATPPVTDAVGAVVATLTGRGQEAANLLQAVPWPAVPTARLDAPCLPTHPATARVRRVAPIAGSFGAARRGGRTIGETVRVAPPVVDRHRAATRPGPPNRSPQAGVGAGVAGPETPVIEGDGGRRLVRRARAPASDA